MSARWPTTPHELVVCIGRQRRNIDNLSGFRIDSKLALTQITIIVINSVTDALLQEFHI